jgi:hypothetical protein
MSIRCPDCQRHAQFVASMEVPPDATYDEIAFFLYECGCGFRGLEVDCEGRQQSHLDRGRRLNAVNAQKMAVLMQDCPDPSDRKCRCEAHVRLGRQEGGKWTGLEGWGADKDFKVEHVR